MVDPARQYPNKMLEPTSLRIRPVLVAGMVNAKPLTRIRQLGTIAVKTQTNVQDPVTMILKLARTCRRSWHVRTSSVTQGNIKGFDPAPALVGTLYID